jgi:hypothetical protein
MMKTLGPLRPGARTVNVNRRNFQFWPTTCTVTEVIPEKRVAFRVDINEGASQFYVASLSNSVATAGCCAGRADAAS